jgi:hypothetical protein
MKIDRFNIIFESKNNFKDSIKNMVSEHEKCVEMINNISPLVVEKYLKLANDVYYVPEIGEKPYRIKRNKIKVTDAINHSLGVNFKVEAYDYKYYVLLTYDEIEMFELNNNVKKYNI